MCDRCNGASIDALEALANGEEVPETPAGVVAVPLMTAQIGPDAFVFATNREGHELISRVLRATGLMVPMSEDES